MERNRVRQPESVQLSISEGDWILVKKHLTAGEQRRIYARMYRSLGTGVVEVDPVQTGLSLIVEYLLDWSLTHAVVREQAAEAVIQALDALPPEDFDEIKVAVEAHDEAMRQLRAQEKKLRNGATALSAISTSAA